MPAHTAALMIFTVQEIAAQKTIVCLFNLMISSHTVHFLSKSLYINYFPTNNDGSNAASSEKL